MFKERLMLGVFDLPANLGIECQPFCGDASFKATLSALLAKRIGNDHLTIRVDDSHNDLILISHGVMICSPRDGSLFDAIDCPKGFTKVEKFTQYYKKFRAKLFVNPNIRASIIVTDKMDMRVYHALQSSIPVFLPWYFGPNSPALDNDELELLRSLNGTVFEDYTKKLFHILNKLEDREGKIRSLLSNIRENERNIQIDNLNDRARILMDDIENWQDKIAAALINLNNINIQKLGLMALDDEGDSELVEYFICNKKLRLDKVSGGDMWFSVVDYLTYFDRSVAERVIGNEKSCIYRNLSALERVDDVKLVLSEIFLNDETLFRIKVSASFQFSLGRRLSPVRESESLKKLSALPNTHINSYGCMGNHITVINKMIMENDAIGVIEQCVASAKSLNFADVTVMERFVRQLMSDRRAFIELPDGRMTNFDGAVKCIKECRNHE